MQFRQQFEGCHNAHSACSTHRQGWLRQATAAGIVLRLERLQMSPVKSAIGVLKSEPKQSLVRFHESTGNPEQNIREVPGCWIWPSSKLRTAFAPQPRPLLQERGRPYKEGKDVAGVCRIWITYWALQWEPDARACKHGSWIA